MPLYEFTCPDCGKECERLSSMAHRDLQQCDGDECGAVLHRIEIPSSVMLDVKGSYECSAILADGSKVPGTFGKGYRGKGGWVKP